MTTEGDWTRAWQVLRVATELPVTEREAWVKASGSNETVIGMVLDMLEDTAVREAETPEPGRRYGRYTIVRLLGSGGMGDVYEARDEDLGRTVAMKFLGAKARLAPSAEERLVREAQSASALNHPNLVTVHEVIRMPSALALVTEFVDGQPLRAFCDSPQPPERVAGWGLQIARGLAAAHALQIVHGDIKPENVMVRADGYIKVLDFGLAQQGGNIVTLETSPFGTVGYMSPEQTWGVPLTGASDVFSLGATLLELLAGHHPFRESTIAATTIAINQRDIELPRTIQGTPGNRKLRTLLLSMLQKNPVRRPTAAQVASGLERIATSANPGRARRWALTAALSLLALAIAGAIWWTRRRPPYFLTTPVAVTDYPGVESQPSLSPDGSQVAFIWPGPNGDNLDIYVKSFHNHEVRRITSDPREESSPAWSPDGAWLAFLRRASMSGDAEMLVVPAKGGPERLIGHVEDPQSYGGIAWWPDSRSVVVHDIYGQGRSLVRLPLNGGPKQALTRNSDRQDFRPAISPDSKTLAFVRTRPGGAELCRMDLTGGDPGCLEWPGKIDSVAWFGGSRQALFSDAHGLWLARMNGRKPESPLRLQEGLFQAISSDRQGSKVVFGRGKVENDFWSLDIGARQSHKLLATGELMGDPDFSPSGDELVFGSGRGSVMEIYTCDREGHNVRQVTFLKARAGSPQWSPDGRWIVFDGSGIVMPGSGRPSYFQNVYVVPARGGAVRRLTDDGANSQMPRWSRDGKWIYYIEDAGDALVTWKLPFGGGMAVQVQQTEMWGVSELDNGYLYYERPRHAKALWRRGVAGGPEELVPGTERVAYRSWDLRCRKLYYLREGVQLGLEMLDLDTGQTRYLARGPNKLFAGPHFLSASPDGKQVVYIQQSTEGDLMSLEIQRQ